MIVIPGGILLVYLMMFDVFQSVLVPRPVGRRYRISAFISRAGWQMTCRVAERYHDPRRKEALLGTFAPLAVIAFLIVWVTGCVIGFGLIFFGLGTEVKPEAHFGDAMYYAGISMLTIGFGDIVPVGGWARFYSLIAGATGLGLFAIVITFLFSIFGYFQQRETFVLRIGERAGAPPSGVTLLTTYAKLGALTEISSLFAEGQAWSAMLLESHLSYPLLAYFRSNHDSLSWIAAFGALLDASNLLLTACEEHTPAEAHFMLRIGRHIVHDLSEFYSGNAPKRLTKFLDFRPNAGVDRAQFQEAYVKMVNAGMKMRDPDLGYKLFASVRSTYAPALNATARWWRIPPTEWIGDRSLLDISHTEPVDPAIMAMIEKLELSETVTYTREHR